MRVRLIPLIMIPLSTFSVIIPSKISINWSTACLISSAISIFYSIMMSIKNGMVYWRMWKLYNNCCPKKIKIVSYKTYIKPWITDDIKILINQKHAHFKNHKRGIIPYETYNRFKNNVTKLVKKAKTNYYFRKFDLSLNCI